LVPEKNGGHYDRYGHLDERRMIGNHALVRAIDDVRHHDDRDRGDEQHEPEPDSSATSTSR
jgi:hypothetical protein